jgi:hypothetical protein
MRASAVLDVRGVNFTQHVPILPQDWRGHKAVQMIIIIIIKLIMFFFDVGLLLVVYSIKLQLRFR